MRIAAIIVAGIALAGCETTEQSGKAAYASCQTEYRLRPGTPEFVQCMAIKEQAKAARDERARIAVAAGMQNMGASMQRQAAMNRPMNCTYSAGYGNTVRQTCY